MDEFALVRSTMQMSVFTFWISTPRANSRSRASQLRYLTENIRKYGHKNVTHISETSRRRPRRVCSELQPGDLVITLGAGKCTRLSEEILGELGHKEGTANA